MNITPCERFELNALNAIAVMVDRGLGVSLVPDWGAPCRKDCNLRAALPELPFPAVSESSWSRASVRCDWSRFCLAGEFGQKRTNQTETHVEHSGAWFIPGLEFIAHEHGAIRGGSMYKSLCSTVG